MQSPSDDSSFTKWASDMEQADKKRLADAIEHEKREAEKRVRFFDPKILNLVPILTPDVLHSCPSYYKLSPLKDSATENGFARAVAILAPEILTARFTREVSERVSFIAQAAWNKVPDEKGEKWRLCRVNEEKCRIGYYGKFIEGVMAQRINIELFESERPKLPGTRNFQNWNLKIARNTKN
ncbi:hypothetical protein HK100_005729 [Physocladia obscura]|uniref:Uncharacterized protein n=1 Tax=Physocladia obscura TaxID=109957 RepID=A0AAD5SR83_9FUNG|nr:hypothetical protein HK100_005729 [Physocladia obscura]